MHEPALTDKFQAIKYMNQTQGHVLIGAADLGGSGVRFIQYRKDKSRYSVSFREERCAPTGNTVRLWMVLAWKATSMLEKARWKFCVLKITPMALVAGLAVP